MRRSNGRKIIIIALYLIVMAAGIVAIFLALNHSDTPAGMRRVKSYTTKGTCQTANDPMCGYCPGKIVNNACFVTEGTLQQYP